MRIKPNFPIPEPIPVWEHFFDLVEVPRPSKNEGPAVDFVENWAKKLGFHSVRDAVNNIVVHVPATVSNASPPVILQCHVDIVSVTAEGNPEGADASHGKIPLVRGDYDPAQSKKLIPNPSGDWINSPFTTLGADNGIGVTMMMALAENSVRRVPLELLFTVDEEAGMTGAIGLDPKKLGLTGTRLINIDTEDDDEITVGSCGGRDIVISWTGDWTSFIEGETFRLTIDGIKGGHSGVEINQGRANANRLLARLLHSIAQTCPVQILEWTGGSRRNAIPDKSTVLFSTPSGNQDAVRSIVAKHKENYDRLYAGRDSSVQIRFATSTRAHAKALTVDSTLTLLRMVQSIPTGICEMTPELPVLVESSCNMAIIETVEGGAMKVICSVRGTTAESMSDVSDSILAISELAGAGIKISDSYPGWKPHLDSELLHAAIEQYEKLFGAKPRVHAIHAGLECGLLVEKLPGLHAISIGPNIKGNHAVGERVQISSVAKSYRYIEAILESL
jgi:dipeptidase D